MSALVAKDPRQEEREARERQRRANRASRAAQKQRDREAKGRRADVIRDELRKPRAKACRCGLRPSMSMAGLMELGEGCTRGRPGAPGYVCPVLDAVRRRLGA